MRNRAKRVGFARLADLAEAAGITRVHLQRILAGKSFPLGRTERALAEALGCISEDLYESATDAELVP